MNKRFMAAVGLLCCTAAAQEAAAADRDLAPIDRTAAGTPDRTYVTVHSWTGWHVGINVGGGFGPAADGYTTPSRPLLASSEMMAGGIGGGQLGFDWQLGNLVLGFEADVDGSGQSGSGNLTVLGCGATCPGAISSSARVSAFGTARGRIGYAVDRWMFYGTGGLLWQSIANSYGFTTETGTSVGIGSNSATRAGYAAAAGVEAALSSNWIAGVDYLYLDTGRFDANVATIAAPGVGPFPAFSVVRDSTRIQNNIVRARIDYRF
jgi:outer membrane immunogenic protein